MSDEYFKISVTDVAILLKEATKLRNNAVMCPDTIASYTRIENIIQKLQRI